MIDITKAWKLTPHMHAVYKEGFLIWRPVLRHAGLLDRPQRLAHFLGQLAHETSGFSLLEENLNYTAPRLMQVWPSRFRTLEEAAPYARNPSALANNVYGGRLGNFEPEDGWKYRGRGLTQLTGRSNYTRIGNTLQIDLVEHPELVVSPVCCLYVAVAFWQGINGNMLADGGQVKTVTLALSGGIIGLESRRKWVSRFLASFGIN